MLKKKIQVVDARIENVQNEIAEKKEEIDRVKKEWREREMKKGDRKTDHPIRDYAAYYWKAYAVPLWETVHSM